MIGISVRKLSSERPMKTAAFPERLAPTSWMLIVANASLPTSTKEINSQESFSKHFDCSRTFI